MVRQRWWRWGPVWPWTWYASGWLALWLRPVATYSPTSHAYLVAAGIFVLLTPLAARLYSVGGRRATFVAGAASTACWAGMCGGLLSGMVIDVWEHQRFGRWLLVAPYLYPLVFAMPALLRAARAPIPMGDEWRRLEALLPNVQSQMRRLVALRVTVVVLLLAMSMVMRETAAPHRPAFDPVVWQLPVPDEVRHEFVDERRRMTNDLERRYLRAGATAGELRALLGPPDNANEDAVAYQIGRPRPGRWAAEGLWLTIYFDAEGRYVRHEGRPSPLTSPRPAQ